MIVDNYNMYITDLLRKTKIYKFIFITSRMPEYQIKRHNEKKYFERRYRHEMNRKVNLKNPQTFTEKITYRLIYGTNPLYTLCADKVEAPEWVKRKMELNGDNDDSLFFPERYGIYRTPYEIDFSNLPDSFVLKSSHASGQVILCKNKKDLDIDEACKTMEEWLNINFYYSGAGIHYKSIPHRIICEELLEEKIIDYKLFCFEGNPYIVKVTNQNKDTHGAVEAATYYMDWTRVEFTWNNKNIYKDFEKPKKWSRMIEIAKILSQDFNFVRVDLYTVNDKIYFSELTFTPNGGIENALTYEWDKKLGDLFEKD